MDPIPAKPVQRIEASFMGEADHRLRSSSTHQEVPEMKLVAAAAALTVALMIATSAQAFEFHRSTIVQGPNGTTTGYTHRTCYNGVCQYDHQVTGPAGYSVNKAATVTQVAPGVYERDVTISGPKGDTYNRHSTITVTH
jgi:hypothetical protein